MILRSAKFLLRVGNGIEPTNAKNQINIPKSLMIPPSLTVKPLDQLINFLFPNMHAYASEPLSITDSTILTPKNLVVDNLNAALITTFPGIEKTYLS